MALVEDILQYNEQFVAEKQYEQYRTDKFPEKRIVILTCMDTRLIELLPRAMQLKNGDAKIVKSAGAIVSHPFGSVMRSILVAVYELRAQEILVIGHHQCGMTGLQSDKILNKAVEMGIPAQTISTLEHSGIPLTKWLTGFKDEQEGVEQSVKLIREHPMLPPGIPVHGLLIHPETGKLDWLMNGYSG